MYFKVRKLGAKPGDDLIVNISKMSKIEELMLIIKGKLNLDVDTQRLFYKGKQVNYLWHGASYFTTSLPSLNRFAAAHTF